MTTRIYIAATILLIAPFLLSSTTIVSTERPVMSDIPAPKTTLFVGNSFTNYNNSLGYHARKLAESVYPDDADTFFFKSITDF